MNKLYTGLALLAAVSLASCKAEGPDDGGKQIPSESTTLTLTPFEKLNASADAVNSHKDDWAQSVLTLNYRSIVNVGASVLEIGRAHV